jgi:hypothetical protein
VVSTTCDHRTVRGPEMYFLLQSQHTTRKRGGGQFIQRKRKRCDDQNAALWDDVMMIGAFGVWGDAGHSQARLGYDGWRTRTSATWRDTSWMRSDGPCLSFNLFCSRTSLAPLGDVVKARFNWDATTISTLASVRLSYGIPLFSLSEKGSVRMRSLTTTHVAQAATYFCFLQRTTACIFLIVFEVCSLSSSTVIALVC